MRKQKSRARKVVLTIVIILVLVIISGGLYAFKFYNDAKNFADILKPKTSDSNTNGTNNNKNIVNVLFLGIDRNQERDSTLGVYRTDIMTLASIDLNTKETQVLSIPRDTYTYIPIENKKDKINHAYAFGSVKGGKERGIQEAINATEKFVKYGKVDYYFLIDMQPIPQIVDKLGGVTLNSDVDIPAQGIKKGEMTLNGTQALAYARYRYDAGGDFARTSRQQQVVMAMLQKLKASNQIPTAISLMMSYKDDIKTDLSYQQMLSFALLASEMQSGNTHSNTVPGSPATINGIWYWIPNDAKLDPILKKVFRVE